MESSFRFQFRRFASPCSLLPQKTAAFDKWRGLLRQFAVTAAASLAASSRGHRRSLLDPLRPLLAAAVPVPALDAVARRAIPSRRAALRRRGGGVDRGDCGGAGRPWTAAHMGLCLGWHRPCHRRHNLAILLYFIQSLLFMTSVSIYFRRILRTDELLCAMYDISHVYVSCASIYAARCT